VLGPEFRQLQVPIEKMVDHRDLRPIIPEWDVNSVFVHKVANVKEWDGAANHSDDDQRPVFGCVRRSHWIGSMLFIAYVVRNSNPTQWERRPCRSLFLFNQTNTNIHGEYPRRCRGLNYVTPFGVKKIPRHRGTALL
jgi:hypothetical protein